MQSRIHPAVWVWLFLLPLTLAAGDVSPRAARLHREAIVVDLHIDTPQRLLDENFDLVPRDAHGHIDLPRMKDGGLDAGFMSIYVNMRTYTGDAATKRALQDRKSTRLNSSHSRASRMPSSA